MSLVTRRKVLLFKIESTYNVDPTPDPAVDAVLCQEFNWANEGLRMVERPAVRASLGTLKQIYAGRLVAFTFAVEMKGSGAAGTAPEVGQLLRACGFDESIVPATSVAYAPVSLNNESGTAYIYEDGKRIIVSGCRGNVTFSGEAGGLVVANFTVTGHVGAQTDVALPTPTYDATEPEPMINAGFTIDGYAATISALNFDMANSLAMPGDVNSADGYAEVTIVTRDVNGSIDPLDELVATEDFIGNFTSGAVMALTTGNIGATPGNSMKIDMPAVSYRDATPEDKDGIAALMMPFGAAEQATDDEVTITFT